jgi:muramoyltetrapeptide carboxypeptidase
VRYLSPKRLRPGSRVALVAPASPFRSDELVAGLDVVRECGLIPVAGPNVAGLQMGSIHAAPLVDRVAELMWAYSDPTIDGVVTVLGGMGSGELLPYLDYSVIRNSRKVLLGISDITALNNGILAGAGLITVNGQYPAIRLDKGAHARHTDCESLKIALELMMSDQPWGTRPFDCNQYMPRTVSPGKAQGHVVGCNLETFCTLLGTPFTPAVENAILFVEDTHKQGTEIGRLLIHLKLAGVLDKVAGIVVGEFAEVPDGDSDIVVPDIDNVVYHYLSNGPPCVYGYSFSHGDWTIPIPVGAPCTMDADTGEVSFNFTMG